MEKSVRLFSLKSFQFARFVYEPTVKTGFFNSLGQTIFNIWLHALFDSLRGNGCFSTIIHLLSFRLYLTAGGSNGAIGETGALDKFNRTIHRPQTPFAKAT